VPFAAVFSAFGASSADVEHTYVEASGSGVEERLRVKALRDMRGEGFAPEQVTLTVDRVEQHGRERVRLKASARLEHHGFTRVPASDRIPQPHGTREVFWPATGARPTPIYSLADVPPCHALGGPAIVEADDTTCAVLDGWSYEIDEYGNPWMHHDAEGGTAR
jgi:N-methylhydantoinase A/oxoprolinase/acetone carboxylase beta subunit